MKQGIATRYLPFGALSLAFVASFAARAQMIEIEEPAQVAAENSEESVEEFQGQATSAVGPAKVLTKSSTVADEEAEASKVEQRMAAKKQVNEVAPIEVTAQAAAVESQPVAISNAMQPTTVPPALAPSVAQRNLQEAAAVQGNGGGVANMANAGQAPNRVYNLPPMGQAEAGNLNHNSGSGQQIIIVPNLQNSPNTVQDQGTNVEAKNSSSIASEMNVESMSRAELLRRERMRGELRNENRVLERLEEGRIQDERARSNEIERFETSVQGSASASTNLESVPVVSADAAAAASASGSGANAVAVATVSTGSDSLGVSGQDGVKFRVSPFGGYRWFENNNSQFQARNDFVTGLSLEGQVNEYLGIEGSFSFARDSFVQQGYGNAYAYGAQMQSYGGGYYAPQCASCQGGYGAVGGGYYPQNGYMNYPMAQSRDSFDVSAGLKLGYSISKVRPFVAAGIGGVFQKYAIDDRYTDEQLASIGWTRSSNYVISNFGGGLDFNLAKNFGIGARFDYQAFLNKKATPFNQIWGDSRNRYRLSGSLQLSF